MVPPRHELSAYLSLLSEVTRRFIEPVVCLIKQLIFMLESHQHPITHLTLLFMTANFLTA